MNDQLKERKFMMIVIEWVKPYDILMLMLI